MDKLEKEARRQYRLWIDHLKEQRVTRGIKTQKELAQVMKISSGYINKLENNQSAPSSMINFFKYLLANGFDLSALYKVRIHPEGKVLKLKRKNSSEE